MEENFIDIFENSKTIAEISLKLFGIETSTTRRKVGLLIQKSGYDWNNHIKNIKEMNKSHCVFCGQVLENNNKKRFCSHSCAAKYNNTKRKVSDDTKEKISDSLKNTNNIVINSKDIKERFCDVCGKKLLSRQVYFCSKKCCLENKQKLYEQYISEWKQGFEDGSYSDFTIDKRVRRYIFEKYNSKCEKCGWGEINFNTNKVPLQIHHKDGNCVNNKEENLQLLCPNCHSLTENFGSRNKNSKRIYRKQNIVEF